jgi:hypothetical protein
MGEVDDPAVLSVQCRAAEDLPTTVVLVIDVADGAPSNTGCVVRTPRS